MRDPIEKLKDLFAELSHAQTKVDQFEDIIQNHWTSMERNNHPRLEEARAILNDYGMDP